MSFARISPNPNPKFQDSVKQDVVPPQPDARGTGSGLDSKSEKAPEKNKEIGAMENAKENQP